MDDVVILSAARTPIGAFQGSLASLPAHTLGAKALVAAIERAGLTPQEIDQVNLGCVLTAGQGQAPARQAALAAGCPVSTGAITLNKVCGSGMRAMMIAANDLRCGDYKVVAAGGMESMSQRALSRGRGARRPAARARQAHRLDDPRRPVGPLQRPPHGQLRRALRRRVQVHPRGAGRLLGRELPPGQGGLGEGALRRGDRPGLDRRQERGRPSSTATRSRSRSTWRRSAACAPPSRRTAR